MANLSSHVVGDLPLPTQPPPTAKRQQRAATPGHRHFWPTHWLFGIAAWCITAANGEAATSPTSNPSSQPPPIHRLLCNAAWRISAATDWVVTSPQPHPNIQKRCVSVMRKSGDNELGYGTPGYGSHTRDPHDSAPHPPSSSDPPRLTSPRRFCGCAVAASPLAAVSSPSYRAVTHCSPARCHVHVTRGLERGAGEWGTTSNDHIRTTGVRRSLSATCCASFPPCRFCGCAVAASPLAAVLSPFRRAAIYRSPARRHIHVTRGPQRGAGEGKATSKDHIRTTDVRRSLLAACCAFPSRRFCGCAVAASPFAAASSPSRCAATHGRLARHHNHATRGLQRGIGERRATSKIYICATNVRRFLLATCCDPYDPLDPRIPATPARNAPTSTKWGAKRPRSRRRKQSLWPKASAAPRFLTGISPNPSLLAPSPPTAAESTPRRDTPHRDGGGADVQGTTSRPYAGTTNACRLSSPTCCASPPRALPRASPHSAHRAGSPWTDAADADSTLAVTKINNYIHQEHKRASRVPRSDLLPIRSAPMSAASGSASWAKRTDDSWNIPKENHSGAWSSPYDPWDYGSNKKWLAEWTAETMADGTPKQDREQSFERADPFRQWVHPKHTDVFSQRPTTPERSGAKSSEPSYVGLPPSSSRCVTPLGESPREGVAGGLPPSSSRCVTPHGESLRESVAGEKESRKRLSASAAATCSKSGSATPPLYNDGRGNGYFVREGHAWDEGPIWIGGVKRQKEDAKERKQRLRDSEKLKEKNARWETRKARRAARLETPAGRTAETERKKRADACDALSILADNMRACGEFEKYPKTEHSREWSSEGEPGEVIGDAVYSESSDSGKSFALGKAPTRNGRKAQHRRLKLDKKQDRDLALFRALYANNHEYFDKQYFAQQYDARVHFHRGQWKMTEQFHHLLAHRGREGEEECWASITLSRTASEAEAPPSPPPSPPPNAKVRKVDRGPLYWFQCEDEEDDAAQTTWNSAKKAQFVEERRRATEESNQRKIDLDKRPPTRESVAGGFPPSSSRCVTPHGESLRESVAGEKVRYERDQEGTIMITESRKRVSASATAATTPEDLDKRPPTWCTADEQRAAADLEQTRAKQRESTKEDLKEYISERKNASDSSSVRLSSGGERHNATPTAATLDPLESAPGAPGERVNPLVQYFDLKAQDAKLDARNAASARAPDTPHRWPTWAAAEREAEREAKLEDAATEKAKKDEDSRLKALQKVWDAGFTERLAYVNLGQEETGSQADSQACSSMWDHEGTKLTFGKTMATMKGSPNSPTATRWIGRVGWTSGTLRPTLLRAASPSQPPYLARVS
jgi:hypothetical protein